MMVEEPGINAFAAGYGPSSAVIGVTRGAVEQLSRDELQGVIAHEFSHILNGDMRLNIRLIGVLFGILVIGLVGGTILRTAAYSSRATSSRSKGGGAAPILVLGLALMIIGYAGLFFGRLIKAAVSRQREYLADAAAAQFTRYPDGIAGALKKIGGWVDGSRMRSPRAEEASHMYFGQGVRSITGLLATHPPLKKRIGRLDPQWDGSFPKLQRQRPTRETARGEAKRRVPEKAEALLGAAVAAAGATAVGQVGRPTQDHITYAAELIEQLPDAVREAAHEPYGGRAVVYALLLDDDQAIRQAQLERLAEQADEQVFSETKRLSPIVDGIDETARLPLIDLVLPALQTMAAEQYDAFKSNVDALVEADQRVDVFEWALRRIILKYLEPRFRKMRPTVVQYYSLKGVRDECAVLLSRLAHAGNRDDRNAAERAFRTGSAHLRLGPLTLLKAEECAFPALNAALDRLAEVTPRLKKTVLEACAASISHDREITVREGELFRGVADALECPVPLLLPGQPLI
jgi:hypothetical protein